MDRAPSLLTPRLRLRGFVAADLDAYAAICADPEVMQHIGDGGPVGRDIAWRQMAMFVGHWPLRGYGHWAVDEKVSDGRGGHRWALVGRVGFLHPEGWPGNELGWLLARQAWGKGYAFEAASAARALGRDHLGITDLISLIRPDNQRSIALAQRLGAVNAGEIDFLGGRAQQWRHPAA
jgi:RimJ/RimL family protein N-acetyltransferase